LQNSYNKPILVVAIPDRLFLAPQKNNHHIPSRLLMITLFGSKVFQVVKHIICNQVKILLPQLTLLQYSTYYLMLLFLTLRIRSLY
jgi:hypothetical protein